MPHQEIYLAALDLQASQAMNRISALIGDQNKAREAQLRSDRIAKTIVAEYTQPDGMYAFSHNPDGSQNKTATIFPSIAWWDGHYQLPNPDTMFRRWASDEFSTDWGTRDVGDGEAVYDPISYHQGSVWPLFTGWASLAEYRTGRDLAAYSHLMQNANLTTEQDLGAVTELLSGAYYSPFGRSTSHQMWSSAMVLVPALRGLFGLSVDALKNIITVDPHLPAQWSTSTLRHVQIGRESLDIQYERKNGSMVVTLLGEPHTSSVKLTSTVEGSTTSRDGAVLTIPLPAVEVGIPAGADSTLPRPGASTQAMKVLEERRGAHQLILNLEAQGGSTQSLFLRRNIANARIAADGAVINGTSLDVKFLEGTGYQSRVVTLNW
jgi:hypothetical protein